MRKKRIILLVFILFGLVISGCDSNTSNNPSNLSNKNIKKDLKQDNINNKINIKKSTKEIYSVDKEDIKEKEKIIIIINDLLNNKKYLIDPKNEKSLKNNTSNFLLGQLALGVNNIKKELIEEEKILRKDGTSNKAERVKKTLNNIVNYFYEIKNNKLYNINFINIKDSINDLIRKHYYTEGYFLLLNNDIARDICRVINKIGVDSKDKCLFTLSKNYNIDLCLDIENKSIQSNCFIYKKQFLGYKQFKNIKECLTNKNVKDRIGNIEGCFEYFYDRKYENILKDLKQDKNILNLIRKDYKNIVILDFVKKYAKVMKNEEICNKFYDKNKEKKQLDNCKKDTIISIFKESNNIKWFKKISDTNIKKFLVLKYYPDIISYNNIKDLRQNNICEYIKNTKEYDNCNDLLFFEIVRDTYRSIDITKKKFDEGNKICDNIRSKSIKNNCKKYMVTSYQVKKGLEKK